MMGLFIYEHTIEVIGTRFILQHAEELEVGCVLYQLVYEYDQVGYLIAVDPQSMQFLKLGEFGV